MLLEARIDLTLRQLEERVLRAWLRRRATTESILHACQYGVFRLDGLNSFLLLFVR